jgi:hypothetical protein
MSKMVRKLIECLRQAFTLEFINKVARETKFVQRESTLTAQKFISLCAFYKDSICKTSLSNLCSIIASKKRPLHFQFLQEGLTLLHNLVMK